MKSVTPELVEAITSPERVLTSVVHVDWDGDGYNGDGSVDDLSQALTTVKIDQVLTSNVPSAATPVVGAAVAQLTGTIEQGHIFGEPRLPVVRNVTTATAATGTGTITVARPTVQPGDTVVMWIASPGSGQYTIRPGGNNVQWVELMFRGDFATNGHMVTGHLLVRKIPLDAVGFAAEPTSYTFIISTKATWAAACVSVSGGFMPGIHKYTTKGLDPDNNSTYTVLNAVPPNVTVPNCLVLGFFAGWAAAGGGVTWTPTAPATELADTCSTSGVENATITVTQNVSPAVGLVQMSATISAATEPGVAGVIAFAPMIAGDETQNAAWTYSELNPSNLLAGKQRDGRPLTASMLFATRNGAQSVPIFTGQTLGVDVTSRARKATLTALDNRELMRTLTSDSILPPTVVAESPQLYPGQTLPYYPGLEATWLVSYLFAWCRFDQLSGISNNEGPRAGNGFFASPNIRPGVMLHAPMHGSVSPFVGTLLYAYAQDILNNKVRVAFDRGPYVASTKAPTTGALITAGFMTYTGVSITWNSTGSHSGRIELAARLSIAGQGTIKAGVSDPAGPTQQYAYLNVSAARVVTLTLGQNSGITRTVTGPTLPNDQAWHNVGVHWDSATGSATFRVDSTNTVVGFTTFTGSAPPSSNVNADMTLTDGAQIAEWQVTGHFGLGSSNDIVNVGDPFVWQNFIPTAFIDKSENVMDAILAVDTNTDVWQLLNDLANAEFAAVYFDTAGYPHYRTRYSDVTDTGQTVQRQLTTLNALKDIDYQSGVSQVANQIQAVFTPVAYTLSGVAWKPSTPLKVPANTCLTIYATMPGVQLPTATSVFNNGNGNTAPDGSGTVYAFNALGGISFAGSIVGSSIILTICNGNGVDLWMVDNTGQATVSITSSWVSSDQTVAGQIWQDSDSIRQRGPQPLLNGISQNKWRQRQDVADTIARILLNDLAFPVPVLTNIKIVGDPRLELGDLVTLTDVDGLGLNGDYRLVGISPDISVTNGFTQTLVARYAGCGVGVWDQSFWDDCSVWGA